MNAQRITYERTNGGYRLQVLVVTEYAANTYTAKLTNLTTGATQDVGGWRNRVDAVDYVQRMYAAKLI